MHINVFRLPVSSNVAITGEKTAKPIYVSIVYI